MELDTFKPMCDLSLCLVIPEMSSTTDLVVLLQELYKIMCRKCQIQRAGPMGQ